MQEIDLVDGSGPDFADFVAWVAERAAYDHQENIRAPKPLGEALVRERLSGWRHMHKRLASTVYNQVRFSLETADRERRESGL